jgi:hypothetical protein
MEAAVLLLVDAMAAYAIIGLAFAIAFVVAGVQRVDRQARGSGVGFRLIILPGSAMLWPVLLARWAGGSTEPPVEHNAHRDR